MAGTPAYLAPEQYAGADPSEASDWYAVGVTLYEALTGRLPFGDSWQQLCSRQSQRDPPLPARIDPEVPEDLNEICLGLLCRDPGRRLSGREAVDKLADSEPRQQETFRCDARKAEALFSSAARGSWRSSTRRSPRSERDVQQPSAFTARPGSARPRWSNGSSNSCRTPTMRWCFAADATSTSRWHTEASTESSTA